MSFMISLDTWLSPTILPVKDNSGLVLKRNRLEWMRSLQIRDIPLIKYLLIESATK